MANQEKSKGLNKKTVAILLVCLLIVGLITAAAYYYFVILKGPSSLPGQNGPTVQELAEKLSGNVPPQGYPASAFKNIVDRSYAVAWKRPSIDETRYIPTKYLVELLDRDGVVVADKMVSGENQNTFAFNLAGIPNLQENQTYWWRVKCLYLDKPTYQFIGGGFTLNEIEEPPYPVESGFSPRGEIKFENLPKYLTFEWGAAVDPDAGDSIKSYDILIKRADGEILQKSTAEPYYQIAANLVAIEDSVISFRVRAVDSSGLKSDWSSEQAVYIRPSAASSQVRETPAPKAAGLAPPVPGRAKADLGDLKGRLIPALRLPGDHVGIDDQISFYYKQSPEGALSSLKGLLGREIKPAFQFEILSAQEFPPKTRLLHKALTDLSPLRLSSVDKIRELPADVYFARLGMRLFPSDEVLYADPVEISFLGSIQVTFPSPRGIVTPEDVIRWKDYIGPSPEYRRPDLYVVKIADSRDLLNEPDSVPDRLFIIETPGAKLDFYGKVAVPFKKTAIYEADKTRRWYLRIETQIFDVTLSSEVVEFYFGQNQ